MSYLDELRKATNVTLTENGGKAYTSTLDPCLDFLALVPLNATTKRGL